MSRGAAFLPLRAAAKRALAKLSAGASAGEAKKERPPEETEIGIERLSMEVRVGGRTELVTFSLRNGELLYSASGEGSEEHLRAALTLLAGPEAKEVAQAERGAFGRISDPPPRPLSTILDGAEAGDGRSSNPPALSRLADALDDVTTAMVRAGLDSPGSASVQEALDTLAREAPSPTPLGLSRWIGRIREALDGHDACRLARLLDGASRLSDALRSEQPRKRDRREIGAWLGPHEPSLRRISDRRMVEVARESLSGRERAGIERRYLADLGNGRIYREERSKTSPQSSVGPCPRIVEVGLAEVERGAAPRRIRLMQYGVDVVSEEGTCLAELEGHAYQDFGALAERYRGWMRESPGIAEPFVLVLPAEVEEAPELLLRDGEGRALAIASADDPAGAEVLRSACAGAKPGWIAGRLVDQGGRMELLPCSAALIDRQHKQRRRLIKIQ